MHLPSVLKNLCLFTPNKNPVAISFCSLLLYSLFFFDYFFIYCALWIMVCLNIFFTLPPIYLWLDCSNSASLNILTISLPKKGKVTWLTGQFKLPLFVSCSTLLQIDTLKSQICYFTHLQMNWIYHLAKHEIIFSILIQ